MAESTPQGSRELASLGAQLARLTPAGGAGREFDRALLESMSDGVVACDAEGVLTLFNRAAREWHGMDPLRLPPEEWPRYYNLYREDGVTPLPPQDVPLARAFRGERVVDAGMAIVARGRPVRFILANGSVITDDDGRTLGAVVVMRDVTELRRIEAELRQANEALEARVAERTALHRAQFATLRRILDSLGAPIYSVDRERRYTSFNESHAQVMAALYDADIRVGDRMLDRISVQADRREARRNLDRALAGESFVREAFTGDDPGTRQYFQIAHHPVRDSAGEIVGAVVLASDLTERRRMEEELRRSEERYRCIFDNVLDCLFLLDVTVDGRTGNVEVNPAFERMTGLARADLLGRSIEEVLPGEIARVASENLRSGAAAATDAEVALDLPVGRRIVRSTLIPARMPGASVSRLIGIWRDITDQKRAEEERRAHLCFLEGLDRVNRAIQAARDADQMMGDVLDVTLDLLDCDRAFLLYPCDPHAPAWHVPMERTRPEWPGALAAGEEIPMEEYAAATLRTLLEADGAVAFGPGTAHSLPTPAAERFGFQGMLSMAVRPLIGQPWQFGIHTCSRVRHWTTEEQRLMEAIGRRVADGLTSLLTLRDLKASEARFRALYNRTPAMLHSIGRDGRLVSVSDYWLTTLGYTREEVIGRRLTEFLADPSRRYAEEAVLPELIERGECRNVEYQFLRKDGSVLDGLLSATSERDSGGTILRSLAVTTDITERRRMEDRLREREAEFRALAENIPDHLLRFDATGRILYANPRVLSDFGRTADQLVGRRLEEVAGDAPPANDPVLADAMQRALREGVPNAVERRWLTRRGERVFDVVHTPERDAPGRVVAVLGIARDVTDRRLLEERLRQAQKMEAVGTLAGGVAHDFNNILTGIMGYATLLQLELPPKEPCQASVTEILAASDRGAQLTRRLLAFSRRQIINPRPVDLNDIVRNVEKLLRRVIGEDVELSTTLAARDLIVMADVGQLEQVLMNLATNARDAMPSGGRLAITTRATFVSNDSTGPTGPKAGWHARLSVADTGVGMDEPTREKVFEPFFTTKELGRGTGLGLAIVYGIVQQHGGTIDLQSEPGRGTVLQISLPLIAQAVVDRTAPPLAPPARGSETILLAEDDPAIRTLMTNFLSGYGYRPVAAVDGQDALEKFAEHAEEIALVVLDVVMPRKSGREVYDAIRAQRPSVPALFVSGYTADIMQMKGLAEEDIDLIAKPISPFDLLRRIRSILDASAPPGPEACHRPAP